MTQGSAKNWMRYIDLHKYSDICDLDMSICEFMILQVDTEACEQTFSWLSQYGKMTRKMHRHTYMFFILYLCDLHNKRELEKLQRANYHPKYH